MDYMLGSSKFYSVKSMNTFLMVVEAKKEWPDSAVPQIVCEAGCLLKKRVAAGKNTPVFGILTNGSFFRFFAVDINWVVYASGLKLLEVGKDDYTTSESLREILRWITWLMSIVKTISPRASTEDLTKNDIDGALTGVRRCFVQSSKKHKS